MEAVSKQRIFFQFALTSLSLAFLLCLTASNTVAQEDPNTISREIPEQTITFSTVNPYTKVTGTMTIVFSGVFHLTRPTEDAQSGTSRVTGGQLGTFTFVPDDQSQPTISGKFRFRLSGWTQPRTNAILFVFRMNGVASDGSAFVFLQSERAVVHDEGCDISFGETRAVDANDD
jgi:hypothetical protein